LPYVEYRQAPAAHLSFQAGALLCAGYQQAVEKVVYRDFGYAETLAAANPSVGNQSNSSRFGRLRAPYSADNTRAFSITEALAKVCRLPFVDRRLSTFCLESPNANTKRT
jgi:hypothetical protein